MAQGAQAERPAIYYGEALWSYRTLLENANRIASVMTDRFGLVPGGRVLVRSSNHPTLVAACLGVLKAGGVVIPTMPVMRERELAYVLDKARVGFAICDARLSADLLVAAKASKSLENVVLFGSDEPDGLEALMAEASPEFPKRGYGGGRRCAHRFHLGLHGNAQGHGAFSPGFARRRGYVSQIPLRPDS